MRNEIAVVGDPIQEICTAFNTSIFYLGPPIESLVKPLRVEDRFLVLPDIGIIWKGLSFVRSPATAKETTKRHK